MERRSLRRLLLIATIAVFAGCGGGGSSSSVSQKNLTGNVEASKVAGVKVCVSGTDNCNVTDEDGKFTLKVSNLPVALEIKIDKLSLGTVTADSNFVPINPLTLAGGNSTIAERIGAFIHSLANDTTGSAPVVNLDNIELNSTLTKPLVEALKEGEEIQLTVKKKEGEKIVEHEVEVDPEHVLLNNEYVNYTLDSKKLLWKFEEFLAKSNGKTIKFSDGNSCKIVVNLTNPLEFKLTDCSNPNDNDDNWEEIYYEDSQVVITDEDGVNYYIKSVDIDAGQVCYTINGTNEEICVTISSEETSETIPEEISETIAVESFNAADLRIETFENRKITFNNGNSYLILYSGGGFKLHDIDDNGDGAWIYDNATKSIVLWPGWDVEYRLWFSNSEPTVGTKMKVSREKGEEVRYDQITDVTNVLYDQVIQFLAMADGKTVTFNDPEESGSSCEVVANPDNSAQFKMVNCTNPNDNDDNWENVLVDDNGQVIIVDEDNATALITYVNFDTKQMFYEVEGENGETIKGYVEISDK